MVTHPNRSRKTISVKLTEDELSWLIYAQGMMQEDLTEGDDQPGATPEIGKKLVNARSQLRARHPKR
jgi:hypothetical protein